MMAFAAILAALVLLFVAGLRLPLPRAGAGRWLLGAALTGGALATTLLANVALFKHDAHFDLTHEKAFTPSAEAMRVVGALDQDVELVYFYQKQNPAGRAAKTVIELMGRLNPRLHVRTVDPDQNPALANRLGMRLYNAALLRAGDERLEVVTTDDREIALAILRLLRRDRRPICFVTGHGEYDIDNFEFHTHFEGQHGHSHDSQGMAVVQMEQHGLGRLRRSLDKLGYPVRKLTLSSVPSIPAECSVLVEANPRTRHAPPEVDALAAYLARGGSLLMLLEPDFPVDRPLAALLARAGLRVGEGVIADPKSHYYTDEQMIAVTSYANHPASLGLALSFFPGARPLQALEAPGVRSLALLSSSAESRLLDRRGAPAASHALAVVAEGRLDGRTEGAPFRLAAVGDADFASNSFFPYLSNADLALGLLAWLRGEARGPAVTPLVEVLPTVALTNAQMRAIFLICVVLMPALVGLAGGWIWWRRRR